MSIQRGEIYFVDLNSETTDLAARQPQRVAQLRELLKHQQALDP
jgi:hypothetical protein